jgi:2-methylcitrate dehydratase PrpD
MAAKLAEHGFTGSNDAIEHPQGFLSAVSPSGRVTREAEPTELGKTWRIVKDGLSIKKYPMCYCTHRLIDAALALSDAHDLNAASIRGIEVVLSETCANMLRNHQPRDKLAAKFSAEFCVAAAIVARKVTLAEVDDAFICRSDIQDLMRRVTVRRTTEYAAGGTGESEADQLTIQLHSGEKLEGPRLRWARGAAERPLTTEELFDKFRACAEVGKMPIDALAFFRKVQRLELESARGLLPRTDRRTG